MKTHFAIPVASVLITAWLLNVSHVQAEIPKRSQNELQVAASSAVTGVVERTYTHKETKGNFEYTYGVAEIALVRVDKGDDIVAKERVFVRYWRKKWIGSGNPPPDHYGHWDIPEKGDMAEIYVKGDRKTGFDVLSPNGFFKVTKAESRKSDPNR